MPKRILEVVDLIKSGVPRSLIAERLGIAPSTVRVYESLARKQHLLNGDTGRAPLFLSFPRNILQKLTEEAYARNLHTDALIVNILTYVASDNLFKAILDD